MGRQFVEAEAFGAEEEFGVGPGAPFWGVYVILDEGELGGGEEGEEVGGGAGDGFDRHAFILKGEEVGADSAFVSC